MTVKENFDLIELNTFRVHSLTKYFILAENENELSEALDFINEKKLPYLLLGSGSNILFTKDFPGIVIHLSNSNIKIEKINNSTAMIIAEAGAVWDDVVSFAVKNNFRGIENLSGIPGTAGAAPVQNIGAYGCELSETLNFVEGYELSTLKKITFNKSSCNFGYRDSIFKNELKGKFIITKIGLELKKDAPPNLKYKALAEKLKGNKANEITPEIIRNTVLKIRNSKLPLPSEFPNAGSFFKNPVINAEKFQKLKSEFPYLNSFRTENNNVKLSAAQLIELSGLKGMSFGNAKVYENHALVIINNGGATGEEILSLANKIKSIVYEKFHISLQFEVNVI